MFLSGDGDLSGSAGELVVLRSNASESSLNAPFEMLKRKKRTNK